MANYSVRELIAALEDLLDEGYRTLTTDEVNRVFLKQDGSPATSTGDADLATRERIGTLSGTQARIALCGIAAGKDFDEALDIAKTYPF